MKLLQTLLPTLLSVGALAYSQHEAPLHFLGSGSSEGIVEAPKGILTEAVVRKAQEKPEAHSHIQEKESLKHDPHHDEHDHGHGAEKEHHEEHRVGPHHGEAEHHGHGHEGGHHEGHHAMSPKEEALAQESLSMAMMLMATVACMMFVFYLVHSKFFGVKLATWRVLNMTASIFVAVLLYGTLKMILVAVFEPDLHTRIFITLTMFVLFYIGTHVLLFKLKGGDELELEAYSTIMAHITGFAAMYGFADCQESHIVEERGALGIIVLIIVAATIIMGLSALMDKVMLKIVAADGVTDEEEDKWIETCDEMDDDVFCLATSFLVVAFFRFLILGEVYGYEPGKMMHASQSNANWLLFAGLLFVVAVVGGTMAIIKNSARIEQNHFVHRITTNVQHLNSMIMAWCFLFWAEWQLYVWGWEATVIGGCFAVAVVLTFASFMSVYLLDFAVKHAQAAYTTGARRATNSIETALGLLVGFSWERAFDVGFEEIEHSLEHRIETHVPATVWVVIMSTVLLAIVAPAWRHFILPKAIKMEDTVEMNK